MGHQKAQLLKHLREQGPITTFVAFDRYRLCRLSERVRELERDGYLIQRLSIQHNGKRYIQYSLVNAQQRAA